MRPPSLLSIPSHTLPKADPLPSTPCLALWQCVEEYSGEERSKILWTEIVKELFALPHDQPREEKLAVLAGMSTSSPSSPFAFPACLPFHLARDGANWIL